MAVDLQTALDMGMSEAQLAEVRELGEEAAWSLSTAKTGFPVDHLRDGSTETYWQSDGPQPHLVNIQFPKKMAITHLALHVDYRHDESYTPRTLSLRIGTNYHDLVELEVVELDQPAGWVVIPLRTAAAAARAARRAEALENGEEPDDDDAADLDAVVRTNFLQVAVVSNHQNGRDTHIRQMRVFGPKRSVALPGHIPHFGTVEMQQFAILR
ncbi:anaphase-promoting complex subunit 10 [Thecamonas trahens ATCC 50062]|uniref:Anaphase-promoting complex subunit 10 n=1 Tax=Thecamonas trahens ATCC 50062 TaxID=461836 RepID=A0A0L0D8D5_THETB|nr:anaphase-promoting complex subunit 10 [Thecamonas trahens ATCC 50062]KNC48505.1 anaphase-promoting complex subunit 10 [Thecamonas trahens ATCC 50062]|eukprot:XP_013758615.1 anaphase-promoting complex subunit 10 [Thecamonas trahens ATCC 50062]